MTWLDDSRRMDSSRSSSPSLFCFYPFFYVFYYCSWTRVWHKNYGQPVKLSSFARLWSRRLTPVLSHTTYGTAPHVERWTVQVAVSVSCYDEVTGERNCSSGPFYVTDSVNEINTEMEDIVERTKRNEIFQGSLITALYQCNAYSLAQSKTFAGWRR